MTSHRSCAEFRRSSASLAARPANTPGIHDAASISCIQAARGNTRGTTADGGTRFVERSLQEWQQKLPGEDFVMLHRSTLANLKHVRSVERWSNYSYRIHIAGLTEPIVMSRRYAGRLRGLLA
jgi:DNA-binding LytR/AlgR family response regulator